MEIYKFQEVWAVETQQFILFTDFYSSTELFEIKERSDDGKNSVGFQKRRFEKSFITKTNRRSKIYLNLDKRKHFYIYFDLAHKFPFHL